ncbi:MAG: aminopeptidase, partial [Bacilli bacterium]|nr:aminopeptidase [Bacilli bacterium]
EKWNKYAKSGAAFLMLASETPGLMKDIDPMKLNELTMYSYETRKEFDELRNKSIVPWCIAAVPTLPWAEEVFPKSKDPLKDLWNEIFTICYINEKNPEKVWEQKIEKLSKVCEKLNSYHFKTLKYKNDLGTDFTIDLPDKHLWASGENKLVNGVHAIANFPTEEVFTSPTYDSANGIVYASKPLCYQDNLIEDFWIKFEKGIATDCHAKKGDKVLKQIISSCKNSNRLGEVALVPYDSPISNSNIIFYETLYDENASCHLALGASFAECLENGPKLSKKDLEKAKLNDCNNHVDFMIGSKDLSIVGTTVNGEEITIFEKGNLTKDFS